VDKIILTDNHLTSFAHLKKAPTVNSTKKLAKKKAKPVNRKGKVFQTFCAQPAQQKKSYWATPMFPAGQGSKRRLSVKKAVMMAPASQQSGCPKTKKHLKVEWLWW